MDEGGEAEVPFDADWKAPEELDDVITPDPAEEPQHVHIPTPAEAEALNNSDPAQAGPQENELPLVVDVAFVVYLNSDGHWCGESAILNRQFITSREATLNDYRHACADMMSDLQASESAGRAAQATMQLQQNVMQQVMAQRQAQQIGDAIGIPGGGVDLAELQRRAAQGGAQGPIIPGR